ncbi:AroB-related putative sugar phosphate phospholyase (cyclizing) [Daejeonella sp.]|uniref:AroB-related putative sugar phosphate phospholyase (cyclizing) n=1 Tax=Daejeonella sp. TaxID=2805397 RepID=UPI002BC9F018|nr:AroB-related putative sugar phosphate phospholyase (cyclizing) [Daejeonella sp.]HQT24932.1 iron-containing alcohol dehydrogenase [Daejeonella sp.]HQT58848.1 iron-containing alcohol dehydrogenase [Daejeonella sp.]
MSDKIIICSRLKDYDVEFIDNPAKHLSEQFGEEAVLVIDQNVFDIYKTALQPLTEKYRTVFIIPNENNKTMDYSQVVISNLLSKNIRKTDTLIAIGGGITQDLVAFISSILFRGVTWAFYPTTLLAQGDSCIGSKSSINFKSYKNLVGTFNPPDHIFISPSFLKTLSESEIRSGIGEMMHYFLNSDLEIATNFMAAHQSFFNEVSLLTPFIKQSLLIKKAVIEVDEFDTSLRHIFNYGHTFGHAIEAITDYRIPHGQAISIGMNIANFISLEKKMISHQQFDDIYALLKLNIPQFRIDENNIEDYCVALSKDKKNVGKRLGCILTEGAGKMKKCFLDIDEDFRKLLLKYSEQYA